MHAVETVVVGAGQAGLAVSRCLTGQGADHVVVERGRIAERWRSARWDSLRQQARTYAAARFDPADWRKRFLQIVEAPLVEPVHEVPQAFGVVAAAAVKS